MPILLLVISSQAGPQPTYLIVGMHVLHNLYVILITPLDHRPIANNLFDYQTLCIKTYTLSMDPGV